VAGWEEGWESEPQDRQRKYSPGQYKL